MKKHFLLLALLCGALTTLLSQKTITGTVLNDKGEPLVGANIVVKGTTIGVITDMDGHYSINIPLKQADDTLICSFVGHESEILMANQSGKLDFKLTDGLLMREVTILAFNVSKCNCWFSNSAIVGGCRCLCYTNIIHENWQNPLTPTPLSNGATLLTYEVNISSKGYSHHLSYRFEDKKIQYQIFKSTDGENYKLIGTSRSDSTRFFRETFASTQLTYGGSQFVDKNINTADTTYYKVEGYLIDAEDDEDEINSDEEPTEREYIFRQTTTVLPVEVLKITNLYVPRQSSQIELSLSAPKEGEVDLIVSDMSGRMVLKHQQVLFKQNNILILPFNDLPSGMYVLSVRQGVQLDNRKFMIIK